LREDDPAPPRVCGSCGRVFDALIRVYIIGVDPDAV
jgi:hypothetical protein